MFDWSELRGYIVSFPKIENFVSRRFRLKGSGKRGAQKAFHFLTRSKSFEICALSTLHSFDFAPKIHKLVRIYKIRLRKWCFSGPIYISRLPKKKICELRAENEHHKKSTSVEFSRIFQNLDYLRDLDAYESILTRPSTKNDIKRRKEKNFKVKSVIKIIEGRSKVVRFFKICIKNFMVLLFGVI